MFGDGRDVDRLALAPPFAAIKARLDDDVREDHVLDQLPVTQVDQDAAIRVADHDIVEQEIAERVRSPADADCSRAGEQHAVLYRNVIGNTIAEPVRARAERYGVVAAGYGAIADPHIAAEAHVESTAVGQQKAALDVEARQQDVR